MPLTANVLQVAYVIKSNTLLVKIPLM